ncbi:MAG: tol-pal system protein YbgF [Desulfovibrionaceae bacterium]
MKKYFSIFQIAAGFMALTLLAGCAAKSDVEALQEESRKSRQETRELYQQLEAELSRKIEDTSSPVQERQADIWAEVSALRQEVAELSGRMDDVEMRMAELGGQGAQARSLPEVAAEVDAIKFALEHQLAVDMTEINRLAEAARAARATAPGEPMPGDDANATAADAAPADEAVAGQPGAQEAGQMTDQPAEQATADPAQLLYDKAYGLFGQRQYEEARRLWAEFTTSFPGHSLVPNALFWQGECYYQMQNYQHAILVYQDVIKGYPKSNKYRYAMLKQGITFYKVGRADIGKGLLEELVLKYPDSTEAARAKQYLKDN